MSIEECVSQGIAREFEIQGLHRGDHGQTGCRMSNPLKTSFDNNAPEEQLTLFRYKKAIALLALPLFPS